jgi:hypothetical protein
MVGAAGIEPATVGLEIRCSIRLSYAPADGFNPLKLPYLVYRTRGRKCLSRRTVGARYRFHRRFQRLHRCH